MKIWTLGCERRSAILSPVPGACVDLQAASGLSPLAKLARGSRRSRVATASNVAPALGAKETQLPPREHPEGPWDCDTFILSRQSAVAEREVVRPHVLRKIGEGILALLTIVSSAAGHDDRHVRHRDHWLDNNGAIA